MKKTYLLVENRFIVGYFAVLNESPYRAVACNFDELADKERAIAVDMSEDEIMNLQVNVDKFINNKLVKGE